MSSNLKLIELSLKNFQSYGNNITIVRLDNSGVTAVVGKNLDSTVDGNISSNGSGKSSVLKAIIYAIYGKIAGSGTINSIINDVNNKNMEVILDFHINNFYYRIHRYRAYKAKNSIGKSGNGIFLLRKANPDDVWDYIKHDITKATTDIDKYIVELIGISFEVFVKIITTSPKKNKPFMDLSLAEQRDIVEETFGYTELSENAERLAKDISNNKSSLESLKILNDQIKIEIDRHSKQLENIEKKFAQWNAEKIIKIFNYTNDLESYNIDYELQKKLIINKSKLESVVLQNKEKINNYNLKISNINDIINNYNEWNKLTKEKIKSYKHEITKLINQYGNIDHDKQELIFDEAKKLHDNLSDLNKKLHTVENDIVSIENLIKTHAEWETNHKTQIESLEKSLKSYKLIFSNSDEIIEFKQLVQSYYKEADELTNQLDKLNIKQKNGIVTICNLKDQIKIKNDQLIILNKNKCPLCNGQIHDKTAYNTIKNELSILESKLDKENTEFEQYVAEHNNKNEYRRKKEQEHDQLFLDIFGDINPNLDTEYKKTYEYEKLVWTLNNEKTTINPFGNQFFIDNYKEKLSENKKNKEKIIFDNNIIFLKLENIEKKLIFNSLKELIDNKNYKDNLYKELNALEIQDNPFATKEKIKELEEEKLQLDIDKQALLFELTNDENDIKNLNAKILFTSEKELNDKQLEYEFIKNEISRLEKEINPYDKIFQDHKNYQLTKLKTEEIEELNNLITHQEFMHKLYVHRNSFMRKGLLTRYLPFLNERIKNYLDKLGLPFRVIFDEDMTVKIKQFKTEKAYSGMSSGQEARINIALSFAFRDVLRKRMGCDVNFWALDEVLDTGLCNVGVQLAAKLIKNIAKENKLSLFVISHRNEIENMFDNKIEIELKNGFSRIINNV